MPSGASVGPTAGTTTSKVKWHPRTDLPTATAAALMAWPSAKIAVMGGSQAAKVLLQIQTASKKAKGETITQAQEKKLLDEIKQRYDEQTTPYYAASRMWVDAIIDPIETRNTISIGIEAANHKPTPPFNPGIIQT